MDHICCYLKKGGVGGKKKKSVSNPGNFSAELFKVHNFIRLIYVAKFHDLYMFYFMNLPDTLTLFKLFPGPHMPLPLEPNGNSTQSFLAPAQVHLCRKEFLYLWNYLSSVLGGFFCFVFFLVVQVPGYPHTFIDCKAPWGQELSSISCNIKHNVWERVLPNILPGME